MLYCYRDTRWSLALPAFVLSQLRLPSSSTLRFSPLRHRSDPSLSYLVTGGSSFFDGPVGLYVRLFLSHPIRVPNQTSMTSPATRSDVNHRLEITSIHKEIRTPVTFFRGGSHTSSPFNIVKPTAGTRPALPPWSPHEKLGVIRCPFRSWRPRV